MWLTRLALLTFSLVLASRPPAVAGVLDGIGVIGDSYSDEYQFYTRDRSSARNWVEILAETRGLNFGAFSPAGRGEPRNEGYAFNWARSEATTDDMIASGQHTGLAAQAARGEVTLACVFIGGNDFIVALKSRDPLAALRTAAPRAAQNYRNAVATILGASPDVKCVLGTLPDIRELPEFAESIRSGQLAREVADAFTAAIDAFNAEVRSLARREPRVAIMDFALATKVANRLSPDALFVGGHRVDRLRAGNGPGHLFLADRRHLGTLGHAMLARCFIVTVNLRFRAGLAPLTDREILACAGLAPNARGVTGLVDSAVDRDGRPMRPGEGR